MNTTNRLLTISINARLAALNKVVANCDEWIEVFQGYQGEVGRGLHTGRKAQAESEIRFLTDLLETINSEPDAPAEIPNPEGDANPAA